MNYASIVIIMILASLLNIGNSNFDGCSIFIGKGESQSHFTCRQSTRQSAIPPLLPYYFGKMAIHFRMKNTSAIHHMKITLVTCSAHGFQLALDDPNFKVRTEWCDRLLHIMFNHALGNCHKWFLNQMPITEGTRENQTYLCSQSQTYFKLQVGTRWF